MDNILDKLGELPEIRFEAGDAIITEGEAAAGLFFLISGAVEIVKDGVQIAESRLAGAVFGEMSFLLETEPTATVRALEPCVMKLARSRREFLDRNPEAASHIAFILARRLDSLNHYLVDLKKQFADRDDHLGMVGDILGSIMTSHPQSDRRQLRAVDDVDD